jgi:hypothetical protein
MLSQTFSDQLRNPPKSFRPIPFWSWNERLDVAETRRQAAEMERVGIGGYFMHARGGLQTEYMGCDWMANIAAGVDEARQRGMGAWAYDENGWPSGFGNGTVTGKGLRYQQKYLRWAEVAAETPRADGRTIAHVRLPDQRLLHFYFDVNPFYVDTLDAEVTAEFLREVYEPYAQRFQADFGQAMPGFFTDEPQVSRNGIPWSFVLPDRYRQRYGEELLPLLPGLFLEQGPWRRTRYRFWHLVQELFVTAFTEPIYRWCSRHGCNLTGHMVLEETLHSQLTSNAAVMPHYEFFHVPGMDWLGRQTEPPTTPVQVASVAHQLGKRQVLSETFALTGWNVSFEELKWMYEWQMVRGATLLCQHLEGYSLRGIRKRDYPPSMFFQQPWWEHYHRFNDAVSRVGMLLSLGDPCVDVLVIHPQSSAWLEFDNAANRGLEERFRAFLGLSKALEAAQIPFHYGDERILRRYGSAGGGIFRVGRCDYRAVIVPPVLTLAASTAHLLRDFAASGGLVVWSGTDRPRLIDGDEHGNAAALLDGVGVLVGSPAEAIAALPDAVRRVRVRTPHGADAGSIAVTERVFGAEVGGAPFRLVYLVNSGREGDLQTEISLPGRSLCRFLMETGEMVPQACTRKGGRLTVQHTFPPCGSLVLFLADTAAAWPPRTRPQRKTANRRPLAGPELAGPWDLELLKPNALTLDTCDIAFDGHCIARREHLSVVQQRALDLGRPVDIELRFAVTAAKGFIPPADCRLAVEQPERSTITVNGRQLAGRDLGPYWDTSFRQIDLEGALGAGDNEIVLRTRFSQPAAVYENLRRATVFEAEKNKLTYDSEIEACYLVGSFGVAAAGTAEGLPRDAWRCPGPFVLTPVPRQADPANLTLQGLPFFAGSVRLRRRLVLSQADAATRSFACRTLRGHVLRLRVNGQELAEWLWRPFEADLDGVLKPGENLIEMELTGGLRNLLGPHHLKEGESYAVGPGSFFKEPNIWGCQPWDDRYCLVGFGVEF